MVSRRYTKTFINIPEFTPLIDTTGSSHYFVGKYLAQLLHSWANNECVLKDSFEAVNRIQDIPSSLFVNGCKCAIGCQIIIY